MVRQSKYREERYTRSKVREKIHPVDEVISCAPSSLSFALHDNQRCQIKGDERESSEKTSVKKKKEKEKRSTLENLITSRNGV